jgi:hypothetical protein
MELQKLSAIIGHSFITILTSFLNFWLPNEEDVVIFPIQKNSQNWELKVFQRLNISTKQVIFSIFNILNLQQWEIWHELFPLQKLTRLFVSIWSDSVGGGEGERRRSWSLCLFASSQQPKWNDNRNEPLWSDGVDEMPNMDQPSRTFQSPAEPPCQAQNPNFRKAPKEGLTWQTRFEP